ncbi:catechol-2,3-dioxygenase [Mangrovibacterium diazotrophicum]|uniref:Catechol-2,3-dioxygenase n=2 Tax=Mangrovibacterium diazotrophicum TaxID=1261403 RepID=A0A419VV72_9BACT|nr:catechol-2,3-dioxygenase [Mangrovibacterium diazotrophicum]
MVFFPEAVVSGFFFFKRDCPTIFSMKIQELHIYTSRLDEQLKFYQEVLSLPLLESSQTDFKVLVGQSVLWFSYKAKSTPYHLAVNIPPNQVSDALAWLHKRVSIIQDEGQDIINFVSWNAKSVYFYDPDHNILEFIARKNLPYKNIDAFDYHSLIRISEIGVPVDDNATFYRQLQQLSDFKIYDGSMERFCAVGDEEGLFIVVNKHQKRWYPTNDETYSSDFEVKFENLAQSFSVVFKDGKMVESASI